MGRQILLRLVGESRRVVGLCVHHEVLLGALIDHELAVRRALGVVTGVDPMRDAVARIGHLDVRGRLADQGQRRARVLQALDRAEDDARVHRPDDAEHGRIRDALRLKRLRRLGIVLVVPNKQADLGAVHAALVVEVFHGELNCLQGAGPNRSLVAGKWSLGRDLNFVWLIGGSPAVVAGASAARGQPKAGECGKDNESWLPHRRCRPPLPL